MFLSNIISYILAHIGVDADVMLDFLPPPLQHTHIHTHTHTHCCCLHHHQHKHINLHYTHHSLLGRRWLFLDLYFRFSTNFNFTLRNVTKFCWQIYRSLSQYWYQICHDEFPNDFRGALLHSRLFLHQKLKNIFLGLLTYNKIYFAKMCSDISPLFSKFFSSVSYIKLTWLWYTNRK